ncbi:hypothetical protein SOVF_190430, partial [Spinacia oleracea]
SFSLLISCLCTLSRLQSAPPPSMVVVNPSSTVINYQLILYLLLFGAPLPLSSEPCCGGGDAHLVGCSLTCRCGSTLPMLSPASSLLELYGLP